MPYYIFRGSTGTVKMATDDKTEKKLPKHPVGKWVFEREVNLVAGATGTIGPSHDDAIAGVAKGDYFKI